MQQCPSSRSRNSTHPGCYQRLHPDGLRPCYWGTKLQTGVSLLAKGLLLNRGEISAALHCSQFLNTKPFVVTCVLVTSLQEQLGNSSRSQHACKEHAPGDTIQTQSSTKPTWCIPTFPPPQPAFLLPLVAYLTPHATPSVSAVSVKHHLYARSSCPAEETTFLWRWKNKINSPLHSNGVASLMRYQRQHTLNWRNSHLI